MAAPFWQVSPLVVCSLLAAALPASGVITPVAQATTVAVAAGQQAQLTEAIAAYDKGDIGKALPLFQQVAQANSGSDEAHLWVAKALMKQGGEDNYAKAKTHLIQALTINPDNPEALVQLGTITGWDPARRDEAVAMLKHALELKSQSSYIQAEEQNITRQLVQLLVWNGDYPQAAQYAQPMRQAFATETKWQALYANLLSKMGQNADAINLYQNYVKPFEQPASPEVLQWRMDYLVALRYGDQAPKARQLFAELYPTVIAQKDDNLKNALAGVAYDLGEYEEALQASQALSPSMRAQADIRLREARTHVKLYQWPQAIALFDGLYKQNQLSAEEILEFADVFAGQQVAASQFPQPGYVNNLYSAVANSPKYANDTELQLRIARYQAEQASGGVQASATLPGMAEGNAIPSSQVIEKYYQVVKRTNGAPEAMNELIGYLMSHKGAASTQAMGRLAQEYPSNLQVQSSYAQMLTWDEATRAEGIRRLIKVAQADTTRRDQWLETLDEVLGWQPATPELRPEYEAILRLDPHHPSAQTAMAQITPKLPTVETRYTSTTTTVSTPSVSASSNGIANPAAMANTPMGASRTSAVSTAPSGVSKAHYDTKTGTPWTTERSMMIQGPKNSPKKVYGYDHSATQDAAGLPMAGTDAPANRYSTVDLPSIDPATGRATPGRVTTTTVTSSSTATTSQPYGSVAGNTHSPVASANYSGSYREWGTYTSPAQPGMPANTPSYTPPAVNRAAQTGQQVFGTEDFLNQTAVGASSGTAPKAYATINPGQSQSQSYTQTYTGAPLSSGAIGEGRPVGERYSFTNSYATPDRLASAETRPRQMANPVVGTAPWQTASAETLQGRIERAKQLTYDRHYSDALELFDDILQVDPHNRDARLGKAYALLWSGQKYSSKRIMEKLLRDYPNDIEIITAMAEVHKAMGRNDKALELLQEVRSRTSALISGERIAVWDFEPLNHSEMVDQWQLQPAHYETLAETAPGEIRFSANHAEETAAPVATVAHASFSSPSPHASAETTATDPQMAALQRELDALNAALNTVEAAQQQSQAELDSLSTHVWETRENLENPVTTYEADPLPAMHGPMQQYFGQTMMAYDDPTRSGSGDAQPLAPYLEDRLVNLENSLFDDLRPELRVGYMFQTQDGNRNTNKLSTWGIPNQVSFSLLPQLRLRGGVVPQRYYLPDATVEPDSNFGMLYTVGATAKPFDRVTLDGDVGLVRFSQSDVNNINYRAVLTFDPWDRVRIKLGSRRLTLANSLLSIAGFKPSVGAFAGEKLGPANETSGFVELNLLPFTSVDVNVAYEFAGVTSRGESPTSYKNQVYASAGYTHRFNDKHWARLGYQFLYMGFSKNTINGFYDVTNFGATQPVVSMSPVTLADPGYDFGGYFSPERFFLNALRLDYRGSLFDRFLEYQIGGSVGIQSFNHGNGIQDSSPTTVAYSADAAVRLNFTDWLSAYGRASYLDSGGFFSRYRLEAGIILRPYIEALSPVIGEKMPKSDDFRQRDSQFPFTYDIFQHYY